MAAPQNWVSVSRRPPDVEDYIDMLRRYRSWVIGPTFAGLVISVVSAYFWPNTYRCTAAMQIRPSAVSHTLLPGMMTDQMAQRLAELQQEILGRDNLIQMIKDPKLDLYPKERNHYSVEDVAEFTFRPHVKIQPYDVSNSNGAQAFKIIFEYPDRNKARAVVGELISQLSSKNLVVQNETTKNTSNLFDSLVQTAKDKLDKAQAALAAFSSTNQGRLPQNFEANNLEVQSLENEISQNNEKIGQEQQNQSLLESALANNKNNQASAEQNLNTVFNTPNQEVRNQNLIGIESKINSQNAECAALRTKYQEEFPSVRACLDKVKSLEADKVKIQQAEGPAPTPGSTTRLVPNAQVAQQLNQLVNEEATLRAQINASKVRVDVLNKKGDALNRRLKDSQDKINASPAIIEQYNALSQELQMAKTEYEKVSMQQETSDTQKSMEEHNAVDQLNILEQPITPEQPISPLRGAIIGIGTLIGLVAGVALAGAKEVKDASLKNLKDVRAYTNLPVLSSIPLLENALLVRRKRRLAWLAWSTAVIVGTFLMSGAVYYYYFMSNQVS